MINVSEAKADCFDREKKERGLYPWKELNEKLYGLRQGELVTLTGGTGLGKSSVTRQLVNSGPNPAYQGKLIPSPDPDKNTVGTIKNLQTCLYSVCTAQFGSVDK